MRFLCTLLALSLTATIGFFSGSTQAQQGNSVTALKPPAPIVSQNFIVHANDAILARKVSAEAERFRKELAIQWLGHELEPWSQKCPIQVKVEMHAGGETSFAFVSDGAGNGRPIDWQMKIYGPPNRLLDAVLPHEVTHTIFATHFGRPLPRWADEGACTTVEHISERKKNHKMLMEFLTSTPSRGIPFNRMFTMRNYPHDILPLYAQGYSLAKFLIAKKGKRHFLNFVGKGLQNEGQLPILQAWDQATNEFYSYQDLSDLQVSWLKWVRQGSNENMVDAKSALATNTSTNQTVNPSSTATGTVTPVSRPVANVTQSTFTRDSGSFYAQEMNRGKRVAANRRQLNTNKKVVSRLDGEYLPAREENNDSSNGHSQSGSKTIWR